MKILVLGLVRGGFVEWKWDSCWFAILVEVYS